MKVRELSHRSKDIFVGIDAHKKTYSVVAVGTDLGVIKVGVVPSNPAALAELLKKKFKGARIKSAYEASFCGFGLHRELCRRGIKSIVVNASSIPVASKDRVKTDKRDALKLARLLSGGLLAPIRVPSKKQELQRLITRTREQVVRKKTSTGIQIKAKLMQFGLLPTENTPEMSLKFLREIEKMIAPQELKVVIGCLTTLYRSLHVEQRMLEKQMAEQAKAQVRLNKLYRSIPGVGPISAAIFMNELGDLSHITSQNAMYSLTGLTPCEFSSGEHVRKGHISRQGSARLRAVLVEVAWRAITIDPHLRTVYERLKIKRGGKRAIVAVARRLAGRIRACLRKEEQYQVELKQAA